MLDAILPYIFSLHAAVTWFLVGLIWFVQIVHYPLMRIVGSGHFREYECQHQKRTTLVVAPAMLLELTLAITIVILAHRAGEGLILSWIGMVLVLLIWASTFGVQMQLHKELTRGFNDRAIGWLVVTNMIRTLLWTARGVIALLLIR
jgi:uncharacterized membrane protein